MDTFMLRLGAHYGQTVVSTEVQEQNLTWVQTGHAVPPNQTTRFTVIPKKRCFCIQGTFQLESNPVQNSS